jgi:anti-sigma-K factor RskA
MNAEHEDRWVDAAGAYVLHAMADDEAVAYAEHLRGCPDCRQEVERLKMAADALPLSAAQMSPPPELKSRIMSIVDAEAELLRAAGARADEPEGEPAPRRRRIAVLRPGWWSVRPGLALGGAAAVLALGALGGILGGSALRGGDETRTVVARTAPAGAKVKMIVRGDGHSTLVAQRLPAPGKGRVYQVWLQTGDRAPTPTNALFQTRSDGSASVVVPSSLKGIDQVLVTSEPEGGSRTPSRDPILSVVPA